ncbi:MAG: hypothetical protein ACYS1C_07980 [Planctomycetota bacterium]|jgi:predicted RNase H-like nuclease (RuvC/YqgF family)
MNAVSKVLVVLVFLLSAGFAVSQMLLYGKREQFGELYQQAAEARNRAQSDLKEVKGQLQDKTVELDRVKNSLETRIQTLEGNLQDEKGRAQNLNSQVADLTAGVQMLTGRANSLEGDIETRDQTILELRQTVSERDQRIQEHLNTVDSLQSTLAQREAGIGQLEHDLTESKKAYRKLAESEGRLQGIIGELVQRDIQVPPAPLPIINGRVVRVDPQHGVAVVDKGRGAGVKPNTEFTIYNEGGYVGRLIIHDVQPDVSVGRVRLLADGQQVTQGDKVTTEIP